MRTIDAELRSPLMTAQLVRYNLAPSHSGLVGDSHLHRLDFSLTPRHQARACYRDRWSAHRFEPLGAIYMVPAGETLLVKGEQGAQTSVMCILETAAIDRWLENELEWTNQRLRDTLDIANANIRDLILRLEQELREPGFASADLTEFIAGHLAIELSIHYKQISDRPITSGLASWRLRLIDECLEASIEPPSLSELAKLCKISSRQLTRAFRISRGVSIGDYISNNRIDRAKRLLRGDQCVKSIAFQSGFATASGFTYAFRRATGQTPRQFRNSADRS